MNTGLVVLCLFTLAFIGPVMGGVVAHRDHLTSLILPASTLDSIEEFQKLAPQVTYEGCQVWDPGQSLKIFLRISNPFDIGLSITKVGVRTFCREHDVFLGNVMGESLPLHIPAKGDGTLTLLLQFTQEGKADVLNHIDSNDDLRLDLKDTTIVIQGIEACYSGDFEIGPISLK